MLKVLKNRTLDELVNCFYTSKKRAVVLAQEDVTSLYAEMAPLIASNETNSYMKKVIKNGDSVLAIAGAFDHLADMVLHGAKNIMAVDINELQFPICWLKYWSFCFFTSCRDYMDFILNPTSKKMLDTDIMKSVLDFVPDGDMKEFWKRIYEQTSPLEIRRNYLYGEQKFIGSSEGREMNYQYYRKDNFTKVKESLDSTCIYLQNSNIFDIDFCGNFDVVHLSNIHNFMSESFTCSKLKALHDKLKPGAKVIIYCMGMRKCWFDISKKGGTILPMDDLNWEFMNEQIFISVQSQIVTTMNIYRSMLELFNSVEVIEVKTSKGMVMYNTGTDCVMVLTK